MDYVLTKHAQDVMSARNIKQAWLEKVLDSPERVEPDGEDVELEHRIGRIGEYGDRVLRVILNGKSRPKQVVTAYFDRSLRDKI